MQNLSLDDLRLLAQLAKYATFLETGQRLGMSTTTVSRRIAALEACVGARLVNRSPSGAVLTEVGQRLVTDTHALTCDLEARVRAISGADCHMSGHVKLSVVEGLVPAVVQAVRSFRQQHPHVSFTLDSSHRALDMSRGEADMALRTLKPRSEGVVLRSVGAIHFGVYSSAQSDLTKKTGNMTALLAKSEAVTLGGELRGLKESIWLRQATRAVALEVETLSALMEAVRLGIGVGALPDEMVAHDPSLRRLGDCTGVPRKTLWLVMNAASAKVARVRGFSRHLIDALQQTYLMGERQAQ
jgi:DNA-binding transcriptional LysR family regulator